MATRKTQSELSNVPRRHGETAGRLRLIASATLAAYAAVAVGAGAGRAQVPNDDAVGISLNRAAAGEAVRVALQGEVIDYAGWSWTPGPVYYTETTGELQQTGGVPIGVAITPTRLLITQTGELPSPTVLGAQPADATLTALAAYNTNGLLTQTAPDTFTGRTLTGTANQITVTNGDGVSGNPTLSLPANVTITGDFAGNQFLADAGSVSATAFGWTLDPDTGFINYAANSIGLVLGGTQKWSIAANTTFIGDNAATAQGIWANGAAGTIRGFGVTTAASPRWLIGGYTQAESGANAGTPFFIASYTDAGALIDFPIVITRAAGGTLSIGRPTAFAANAVTGSAIAFTGGSINGVTVGASTPSTGAFTTLTMSGAFLLEDSGAVDFTIRSLANTDVGITLTDLSSSWTFGLDNSDANAWVLSSGTGLGTNNVMRASIAGSVYALDIANGVNTETVNLQLGNGRTGNGFSIIDLVGDATYTNFGLRLMRLDAGPNADSEILHRGTGSLVLSAEDANGSIELETNNLTRVTVDTSGVVTIGANVSFDQTAANNENPTVSQFIVTNGSDGRHRKASASHAMQQARAAHVIASQAIATGTNTTTINLPSGNWIYVDLVIAGLTAGSDFAPYLRINGDSTAGNYRYANHTRLMTTGAGGTQGGGTTPGCINLFSVSTTCESTNGVFNCTVRIYNPASTTVRKTMNITIGGTIAASDGNYYGMDGSAAWLSTSAITSITLHIQNTGATTIGGSGVNATAGTMYLVAPL